MDNTGKKSREEKFKDLNVQLFGFLLIAIAFIITGKLFNDKNMFIATVGMSGTIFLWIISLIQFFGAEDPPPMKKSEPESGKAESLGLKIPRQRKKVIQNGA